MEGYIESIEPMSFDNGPGIRVDIRLDNQANIKLTPKETVDRIRKFRPYFGPDGGGVTITGEDIFKQREFLKETFKICHKAGINTCIKTNGIDYIEDIELFKNIDLVLLEIISLPLYNYNNLSDKKLMNIHRFINKLNEQQIDVWVKQIIKKDVNNTEEYMHHLKKYIMMYDNIKDIELIADGITEEELENFKRILKEV